MMNKKKLLSTICAAALTVSVVGGSIVSAAAADRDTNILKGKVTDIEETTITLELTPVGAPDQKNDGAALLPAAKPDGEEQDDLTPPEKPADDQQNDQKQPPEKKSVEVDVADATITEDGQDAAVEDIEVGDMLTVELDEDGNAVSVTINNLPAPRMTPSPMRSLFLTTVWIPARSPIPWTATLPRRKSLCLTRSLIPLTSLLLMRALSLTSSLPQVASSTPWISPVTRHPAAASLAVCCSLTSAWSRTE